MTTLEERRQSGDLIEAHNTITSKDKVQTLDFINFHHHVTICDNQTCKMTRIVPNRPNMQAASCNLPVFRIPQLGSLWLFLHCCRYLEI